MRLRLECLKSVLVTVALGAVRAAGAKEQWREVQQPRQLQRARGGKDGGGRWTKPLIGASAWPFKKLQPITELRFEKHQPRLQVPNFGRLHNVKKQQVRSPNGVGNER
jgi:hypothetical protein